VQSKSLPPPAAPQQQRGGMGRGRPRRERAMIATTSSRSWRRSVISTCSRWLASETAAARAALLPRPAGGTRGAGGSGAAAAAEERGRSGRGRRRRRIRMTPPETAESGASGDGRGGVGLGGSAPGAIQTPRRQSAVAAASEHASRRLLATRPPQPRGFIAATAGKSVSAPARGASGARPAPPARRELAAVWRRRWFRGEAAGEGAPRGTAVATESRRQPPRVVIFPMLPTVSGASLTCQSSQLALRSILGAAGGGGGGSADAGGAAGASSVSGQSGAGGRTLSRRAAGRWRRSLQRAAAELLAEQGRSWSSPLATTPTPPARAADSSGTGGTRGASGGSGGAGGDAGDVANGTAGAAAGAQQGRQPSMVRRYSADGGRTGRRRRRRRPSGHGPPELVPLLVHLRVGAAKQNRRRVRRRRWRRHAEWRRARRRARWHRRRPAQRWRRRPHDGRRRHPRGWRATATSCGRRRGGKWSLRLPVAVSRPSGSATRRAGARQRPGAGLPEEILPGLRQAGAPHRRGEGGRGRAFRAGTRCVSWAPFARGSVIRLQTALLAMHVSIPLFPIRSRTPPRPASGPTGQVLRGAAGS